MTATLPPFQSLLDEHAADVMAVLRGAVGRTDAEDSPRRSAARRRRRGAACTRG